MMCWRLESGVCEVDCLPIAVFNALADLAGGLAELRLLVGVDGLAHAGGAGSAVGALEAGVEGFVTEGAVAAAVAGLGVEDLVDLCGHLVRRHLEGVGEGVSGELAASQNRVNGPERGDRVEGRRDVGAFDPVGGAGYGDRGEEAVAEPDMHRRRLFHLPVQCGATR